jgi:hypothetical protein
MRSRYWRENASCVGSPKCHTQTARRDFGRPWRLGDTGIVRLHHRCDDDDHRPEPDLTDLATAAALTRAVRDVRMVKLTHLALLAVETRPARARTDSPGGLTHAGNHASPVVRSTTTCGSSFEQHRPKPLLAIVSARHTTVSRRRPSRSSIGRGRRPGASLQGSCGTARPRRAGETVLRGCCTRPTR